MTPKHAACHLLVRALRTLANGPRADWLGALVVALLLWLPTPGGGSAPGTADHPSAAVTGSIQRKDVSPAATERESPEPLAESLLASEHEFLDQGCCPRRADAPGSRRQRHDGPDAERTDNPWRGVRHSRAPPEAA